MKNSQKGSAIPYLVAVIALLIVAGGYYVLTLKSKVSQNAIPQMTPPISNESGQQQTVENQSDGSVSKSKIDNSLYLFESKSSSEVGNSWVFGLDGGVAVLLPDWLVQNWRKTTSNGRDVEIYPSGDYSHQDISPIGVYSQTSTEEHNAEGQYNYDRETKPVILSEIILANDDDTRIYHVEFSDGGYITENFYIDGTLETIQIRFSASVQNSHLYIPFIKAFVEDLTKGLAARG